MSFRKREKFSEKVLPFCCWTHIITFINDKELFLSILLTVKGLFRYILSANPTCTNSIPWNISRIPERQIVQVSNIQIMRDSLGDSIEDIEAFFKKEMGCLNFLDLFEKILEKFPKLIRLNIALGYKITQRSIGVTKLWNLNRINLSFFRINPIQLRELRLTISQCELEIKQEFPLVESLELCSIGHYVDDDLPYCSSSGMCHALGIKYDLEVDWKTSFPSLKYLHLFGWKLRNDLKPLRKRLVRLELDFVKPQETRIVGYERLEVLTLRHDTIESIVRIEKMKSLEQLSFHVRTKAELWETGCDCHEITFYDKIINFSLAMKNLPSLKSFLVFCRKSTYFTTDCLEIENLPKLEKIVLRRFMNSKITLEKLPNLKSFSADRCSQESSEKILPVIPVNIKFLGRTKLTKFILENTLPTRNFFISFCNSGKKTLERVNIECNRFGTSSAFYRPTGSESIVFDDFSVLRRLTFSIDFLYLSIQRVSRCPKLEFLSFRNPEKDLELFELPSLKNLTISGCKEFGVNPACPNVKILLNDKSRGIREMIKRRLKHLKKNQYVLT